MTISHCEVTYGEVAKFLSEVCSVYICIRIVRIPQKAPGNFHVWKLVTQSYQKMYAAPLLEIRSDHTAATQQHFVSFYHNQIQMEILKSNISTSGHFSRVRNILNCDYNASVTVSANCVYTSYCLIFLIAHRSHQEIKPFLDFVDDTIGHV